MVELVVPLWFNSTAPSTSAF